MVSHKQNNKIQQLIDEKTVWRSDAIEKATRNMLLFCAPIVDDIWLSLDHLICLNTQIYKYFLTTPEHMAI